MMLFKNKVKHSLYNPLSLHVSPVGETSFTTMTWARKAAAHIVDKTNDINNQNRRYKMKVNDLMQSAGCS